MHCLLSQLLLKKHPHLLLLLVCCCLPCRTGRVQGCWQLHRLLLALHQRWYQTHWVPRHQQQAWRCQRAPLPLVLCLLQACQTPRQVQQQGCCHRQRHQQQACCWWQGTECWQVWRPMLLLLLLAGLLRLPSRGRGQTLLMTMHLSLLLRGQLCCRLPLQSWTRPRMQLLAQRQN